MERYAWLEKRIVYKTNLDQIKFSKAFLNLSIKKTDLQFPTKTSSWLDITWNFVSLVSTLLNWESVAGVGQPQTAWFPGSGLPRSPQVSPGLPRSPQNHYSAGSQPPPLGDQEGALHHHTVQCYSSWGRALSPDILCKTQYLEPGHTSVTDSRTLG